MGERVLVAYASKCGSTAEVAEAVGEALIKAGLAVDVRPAADVQDLEPYRAVIVGTAIRMGKPLKEALALAGQHREALQQRPVACFSVGTTMRDATPEKRAAATAHLRPLLDQIGRPAGVGLFAGKVDRATLGLPWRLMIAKDGSGEMREGDWRDWAAIRAWATALVPALRCSG